MSESLVDGIVLTQASVYGACRIEDLEPTDLRVAHYPDGSKRIQGGYRWQDGRNHGVTWKDLPMVNVDKYGQLHG